jgi:predicted nucleic acid-binding Zn ribbon protein
MAKEVKSIIDHALSRKTEITCKQCGAVVKLQQNEPPETDYGKCESCGAEYKYMFFEAPFDGPSVRDL